MSFRSVAKQKYSDKRLKVVCEIALTKVRIQCYSHLKSTLSSNKDCVYLENKADIYRETLNKEVQGYVSEYFV